MEEIIEHFGIGFLEAAAIIGMFAILTESISEGGIFRNAVVAYMYSLCG